MLFATHTNTAEPKVWKSAPKKTTVKNSRAQKSVEKMQPRGKTRFLQQTHTRKYYWSKSLEKSPKKSITALKSKVVSLRTCRSLKAKQLSKQKVVCDWLKEAKSFLIGWKRQVSTLSKYLKKLYKYDGLWWGGWLEKGGRRTMFVVLLPCLINHKMIILDDCTPARHERVCRHPVSSS